MRICGIVSEYNPFHKGHAHQILEAKAALGEDCAVVCCMSSDFVQRGDAAILSKHLRAKAAILGGADVVLELPAPYALRSAEGFAQSAVDILLGIGVLTDLSFGSEDADPELLKETASLLLEHQTVQDTLLHQKPAFPTPPPGSGRCMRGSRKRPRFCRSPTTFLPSNTARR